MIAVVISDKNDRGKEGTDVFKPVRQNFKDYASCQDDAQSGYTRRNNLAILFKRVGGMLFVLVIPDSAPEQVLVFHSDSELVAWYKNAIAA